MCILPELSSFNQASPRARYDPLIALAYNTKIPDGPTSTIGIGVLSPGKFDLANEGEFVSQRSLEAEHHLILGVQFRLPILPFASVFLSQVAGGIFPEESRRVERSMIFIQDFRSPRRLYVWRIKCASGL